jgi:hypothetical protein
MKEMLNALSITSVAGMRAAAAPAVRLLRRDLPRGQYVRGIGRSVMFCEQVNAIALVAFVLL